jgi:hypothetical protein
VTPRRCGASRLWTDDTARTHAAPGDLVESRSARRRPRWRRCAPPRPSAVPQVRASADSRRSSWRLTSVGGLRPSRGQRHAGVSQQRGGPHRPGLAGPRPPRKMDREPFPAAAATTGGCNLWVRVTAGPGPSRGRGRPPPFLGREVAATVAESAEVDRAGLLDEHACGVPSTSISGRNEAPRAAVGVGVGAMSSVDNRSSASDRTTTPSRTPACSWPRQRPSRSRKTSPRRTEALHQRRDLGHADRTTSPAAGSRPAAP